MSKNVSSTWALGTSARAAARRRRGRACPGRPPRRPAARPSRAAASAARSARIPRAMAPEVTSTTGRPRGGARPPAAQTCAQHVRAHLAAVVGDDARSELDDDEAHLSGEVRTAHGGGRPGPQLARAAPGSSSKTTPADLDVVARLEPGRLERPDHADRAQALLDVAQRLLVLEVVAGDQPLDPAADDPERARAPGSTRSPLATRPVDAVLGDLLGVGPLPRCAATRRHGRGSPPEVVEAGAGGRRGDGTSSAAAPSRSRHSSARAPPRPPARGRPSTGTGCAAAPRGRRRSRDSSALDVRVVLHRVRAVDRARGRARARAAACARRGRGTRGRGRRPLGALDQPGDVGDHELAVVGLDRAEHRARAS